MNLDVTQLFRAGDELAKFLYVRGARRVRLSYDFGESISYCAVSAPGFAVTSEDDEYLRKVFDGPVQPEIASYYGGLAGRRRDGLEMELVGTMVELERIDVSPEMGTTVVLSRRELDFYRERD